ncbi:MAG: phage holin family protein [Candidatus Gracilibacteria bacterium]|jgi:putative membrane protein|nr:phage holin family protein [Candidatus Gracilibacteria bacterium]
MFKRIFFGILFNSLCLYAVVTLIDGVSYTGGLKFFILTGFLIGLLNAFVKPILKILAFPAVFLTGGLFIIVINAVLLRILVYLLEVIKFSDLTLKFDGLYVYLLSALLFGIINWLIHLFVKK